MKKRIVAILVFTLSAAGCSAMLDFNDYTKANCGNGVVEVELGEQCDDGDDNGLPGYCSAVCDGFLPNICGNGVLEPGEECDDEDFGGMDCVGFDYGSGAVSCREDCRVDITGCDSPAGCAAAMELGCGGTTIVANTRDLGSRNSMITYCGNAASYFNGREMVYRFESPIPQQVRVLLTGLEGDLDLLIVPDDGSHCGNQECLAADMKIEAQDEMVSFMAEANQGYFIVIDGVLGYSGPFELRVDCLPSEDCTNAVDDNGNDLVDCEDANCLGSPSCVTETNCSDGLDNDVDELVDCLDSDCVLDGACAFQCQLMEPVVCGALFASNNYGPGSSQITTGGWCGFPETLFSGPERFYRLDLEGVSWNSVTFVVRNLTADVDLFALHSDNAVCRVDECAPNGVSRHPGLQDESVSIVPVAGTDYFFAVDGWSWAYAHYEVEVICSNP